MVVKKINGITISHDDEKDDEGVTGSEEDGFVVTAKDTGNTITLEGTVTGAHVSADGTDQELTWRITSKGARSKAKIEDKTKGVITIPEGSFDNIIKVTATSNVDKSVTKTIRIKVTAETSAP